MGYFLLETVRMDTVSATAHWEGVEILDTFYVFTLVNAKSKRI